MIGLGCGPSMLPSMGRVNLVWTEKPEYVAVGEVVCFSRSRKWGRVMHRVIDIDASGLIYIKGDNAPDIDCVSFSKIHFKVTKFRKVI